MSLILIENLYEITGEDIPTAGQDNLGVYDGWSLLDAAQTTQEVPSVESSVIDLYLMMDEASDGTEKYHKWEITVTLNGTYEEIFTEEFLSPVVADTISERSIEVSNSGKINGVLIQVGDTINLEIRRKAASESEDPNDIRVYGYALLVGEAEATVSECRGDIGALIDECRDLCNEWQKTHLSDTQFVRAFNAGLRDVAKKGYWTKETGINVTAGDSSKVLSSVVTDLVKPISCRYTGAYEDMLYIESWQEFEVLKRVYTEDAETPRYWTVKGGILYWCPGSLATASPGIYMYHSYLPPEVHCLSNYTLPIPGVHSELLMYFALMWFHSRFYSDNRQQEVIYWRSLYEMALGELLEQAIVESYVRPII